MKYLIFAIFCFSLIPAAFLLIINRSWLRYAALGIILPAMLFDMVSINFFSHELYRGTSRGMEISLIYLAAMTILLVYALTKKFPSLLPETGIRLFFCYVLLSLPSFLHADNCLFSFFELWKMFMLMLVFLGIFYYLTMQKDLLTLLGGFGIVTIGNFLTVIWQHFHGIHQAPGLFSHQNSMGIYMILLGTVFFSCYLNRKKDRIQLLAGILFLFAAACCARTYSRGAITCFPFGCLLTAFLSLLFQFRFRKLQVLLPLVILCILGALVMLPKFIHRFEHAPKESLQKRQFLADSALNMIRDKPFIGIGLNNWGIKINPPYPYCQYRYNNAYYANKTDFKEGIVETIYLLVGAECGIPCLLVLLCWMGYYLYLTFSLMKDFSKTELFFLPAGLFGGLLAIYLQSTLEWVLKQQVNFCQLMIFFAVLSYLNLHKKEIISGKLQLKI